MSLITKYSVQEHATYTVETKSCMHLYAISQKNPKFKYVDPWKCELNFFFPVLVLFFIIFHVWGRPPGWQRDVDRKIGLDR